MLITLTVKDTNDGGHIHLKKVDMDGEKEIGEIHYENSQDRDWLLMVLMEGHPNVTLMRGNLIPESERIKQQDQPCCFFGALIDQMNKEG
jgi:hypothetical protein